MDLAAAMDAELKKLTGAGLNATDDVRDLNPPAFLLRPPTITYRFGKGWDANWELWAIWPDTGQRQAIAGLGPLIEKAQAALGFAITTGRPDMTSLPQGAPAPTYVLGYTTRIPLTKEAPNA